MLTRKKIFLSVAAAALTVRLIFALLIQSSFFDSYHLVPGLDMQTLLRFSEWGSGADHPPFFTMHRLVIYLDYLIGAGEHHIWVIFAIQAILGIAAAVCAADLTLRFSRSRKAALICGVFFSLYLPFLVYEFSILQESFMVYFALFAFWATVNGISRRFDRKSSILFALAYFAALAGRPAALFMCGALILFAGYKMQRRRMLKKVAAPLGALTGLLILCAVFNGHFSGIYSPFYNVLPYTMQFNAEAAVKDAVPGTPPPEKSLLLSINQAVRRVPTLFKHGELPENQNIYFWCEKIPELKWLPGPGAFIPLAVAGIMAVIFSGAWEKRYGLLLIPVIMLALPLCARDPIGRYRLMLIPYFFIITGCAVVIFLRLKEPKFRFLTLLGAGIGAFFAVYNGDVPQKIRPFDYSAYAMAMENSGECSDPEEFLEEYLLCWKSMPESETSFCMLMDKLIRCGKTDHALYITGMPETASLNPDLLHFYRALCRAQKGEPEETEKHLRQIRNVQSLPPHAYKNAFMLRNWAADALKKRNL